MIFAIIKDLKNDNWGKVGLLLPSKEPRKYELLLKGGEITTCEKIAPCNVNPNHANMYKKEADSYDPEISYIKAIDSGFFGYIRQSENWLERAERMDKIQRFKHEATCDYIHACDILWLMEAGALFDAKAHAENREKWLESVRNQPKVLPGEQLTLI